MKKSVIVIAAIGLLFSPMVVSSQQTKIHKQSFAPVAPVVILAEPKRPKTFLVKAVYERIRSPPLLYKL
jgi:hypothetical protein